MTESTARGSSDARITPAEPIATSVPAPIAIPTSAWARAGASLTPSPTMATARPSSWMLLTLDALSSGRTPEKYLSIPSSSETEAATASASPVIITTSIPRSCNASMAARDSVRTSSTSRSAPATTPSTSTCRMIAPSSRQSSATGSSRAFSCSSR